MAGAVGVVAALSVAAPGRASDGVLQINQACATNGGCFPGDSPGFPVTITQPGSYRLTGNLTVAALNTDAVDVTVSGVTVDLGGFTLQGPVTCSGSGSSINCAPSETSGSGVSITSSEPGVVSVRHGVIRGFYDGVGSGFINTADNTTLLDLRLLGNLNGGALLSFGALVRDVNASYNGGDGLVTLGGSLASIVADGNGGNGIQAGGTLEGAEANSNGKAGVYASTVVLRDSLIGSNTGDGVDSIDSSIIDCYIVRNGGYGIRVGPSYPSTYSGNTIIGNTGGTVLGPLTSLGASLCNTLTCP